MTRHSTIRMTSIIIIIISALLTACSSGNNTQDTVYPDMKEAFDKASLMSANIGIFNKITEGDSISYGECGSGVIIEKKDGFYYALTAAHVVSVENAELLVFTTNTEMKSESIPGIEINTLSQDTYDSMYSGERVFISSRDDLAVIRFKTDENLSVIQIGDSDPNKGDRIMCVGNPQNEWFAISYGTVTSGIEKFGELQGFTSNAMKHNAYIQVGSSGGAAINEQMKLAGITPGASLSLDGKSFKYGVLIPVSEIRECLKEWNRP